MLTISLITLFPDFLTSFLEHSIIKRAQEKERVRIKVINLRNFAEDNYQTVDDRPYGGGAGMILKIDIAHKAIQKAEAEAGLAYKVLLSPQGNLWTQSRAEDFVANLTVKQQPNHLLILCGHYEGYDSRIDHFIDEKISIGHFVLSSGEVAATVMIDSLLRLLPGVLKKDEATKEETFMRINKTILSKELDDPSVLDVSETEIELFEYPQFTRPEEYLGHKVPQVLLSGNHKDIKKWRLSEAWKETQKKQS